jgi:hypothetical protein
MNVQSTRTKVLLCPPMALAILVGMEAIQMENKPKMPEAPITEEVVVSITARLSADHGRFSNSTILVSATQATFKAPDGSEGNIFTSIGGNAVEVRLGERSWYIDLAALAQAAWDADQAYLAKVKAMVR